MVNYATQEIILPQKSDETTVAERKGIKRAPE